MFDGEVPTRASIPESYADRFVRMATEGKLDKYTAPHMPEKTASNKEAKGSSIELMRILGLPEQASKSQINGAIVRLVTKAQQTPWELTPAEDKVVASAGGPGTGMSIAPEAVAARFAQYGAQKKAAGLEGLDTKEGTSYIKPSFDPAQTQVQNFISAKEAPPWQGNKAPTQQDVTSGKQAPAQFKTKFPAYAPPPPQQKDPTIEDTNAANEPDEED
jgi:hypothetical protein